MFCFLFCCYFLPLNFKSIQPCIPAGNSLNTFQAAISNTSPWSLLLHILKFETKDTISKLIHICRKPKHSCGWRAFVNCKLLFEGFTINWAVIVALHSVFMVRPTNNLLRFFSFWSWISLIWLMYVVGTFYLFGIIDSRQIASMKK